MECYGFLYNKRRECKKCELKSWCKHAGDPPRLSHQMLDWDSVNEVAHTQSMYSNGIEADEADKTNEQKIYSKNDLFELLGFLMAMDLQTLDMLDEKIRDPGVSFSKIAQKRGISRQAVHKYIKQHCEKIPELKKILMNNSQKKKTNKTFKEAVCQIQKRMSAKKSKKQKAVSKSSRRLIYWSPSLDLSKMSIFKGSSIIKNVSKH